MGMLFYCSDRSQDFVKLSERVLASVVFSTGKMMDVFSWYKGQFICEIASAHISLAEIESLVVLRNNYNRNWFIQYHFLDFEELKYIDNIQAIDQALPDKKTYTTANNEKVHSIDTYWFLGGVWVV
jgi:hypothetical protein